MKIGIFDSGLGGLVIAKAIFKKLPRYDYVYLGDTKRVPYGNRAADEVYRFTKNAVQYLFEQNCQLIILACNTASALALRKIQQQFLPRFYPDRRVLGVVIPTLEIFPRGSSSRGIGVLATSATIKSHIYKKELIKINARAKIYEQAAPKLVPMIEENKMADVEPVLRQYLTPLTKHQISAIILGCTHYPILKTKISQIAGKHVKIVSQTDIIPLKLGDYLQRHKEIANRLSKKHQRSFFVTKYNRQFGQVAKRLFGKKLKFKVAGV